MFDPIMEQVGLGPVERSHLSHTIGQVRQTVDSVAPRLRSILDSLQQTAAGVKRDGPDVVRPKVEQTADHIEGADLQEDRGGQDRRDPGRSANGRWSPRSPSMIAENRSALEQDAGQRPRPDRHRPGHPRQATAPSWRRCLTGFMGTRARLDELLGKATIVATAAEDTLVSQPPQRSTG